MAPLSTSFPPGDPAEFPITAVLVIPDDERANTLLQGTFLASETLQIVEPGSTIQRLLTTILTVRRYVFVGLGLTAVAGLSMMILVFLLSIQLRRRELNTMLKLGATKGRIFLLLTTEIISVILMGVVVALIGAWTTSLLTDEATQWLLRLA